jgi:hypothetical protein
MSSVGAWVLAAAAAIVAALGIHDVTIGHTSGAFLIIAAALPLLAMGAR